MSIKIKKSTKSSEVDRKGAIRYVERMIDNHDASIVTFETTLRDRGLSYAIRWKGEDAVTAEALLPLIRPFQRALCDYADNFESVLEFIQSEYVRYMQSILGTRSGNDASTCAWSNCVDRSKAVAYKKYVEILRDLWEILEGSTAPASYDHFRRGPRD